MIPRREFVGAIAALGGIVAWPAGLCAQPAERPPRIGVLLSGDELDNLRFVRALKAGMAERGYEDGKNIRFEVRYSDRDPEKLARNARELAAANVALIWVPGSTVAQAAREATGAIPIVFAIVSDPVHSGFVRSLAAPGTNMTGLSLLSSEMWGKRLELLHEVRTGVRRLGVLAQPGEPASAAQLPHIQRAAAALGLDLLIVGARSPEDLPAAVGKLEDGQVDALIIVETGLFLNHAGSLIDKALRNRWPTVNSSRQYAEIGGLLSYGVDYLESCKRSAEYVDKILKGAKPADLPVEQPTKFELVVNLKTAKAIGIAIPQSILLRADEVIE
jgi:putative ABC transport system substrate-binding protein